MENPVTELIESWPEPQQAIAFQLRSLVLGLDIGIEEAVKWKMPTFFLDSNVCGILCCRDHVNLQFFNGADLTDPANKLEGTGKSMRHIKFYSLDELDRNLVSGYVREAGERA